MAMVKMNWETNYGKKKLGVRWKLVTKSDITAMRAWLC